MQAFKNGQRVVVEKEDGGQSGIKGKIGTVVRLRHGDDGAWISMDENIPENVASFPKDDQRRNHVLLYPDQCSPLKP